MARFVAPNLDNATPQFLLDEMGALSVIESHVKRLRAFYKEAYYARIGIVPNVAGGFMMEEGEFPREGVMKEGDTFVATTTMTEPSRFDQKAFAEVYPKIFEEFKRSKPQLTTRFQLKEGVNNPVVNDLLQQMKDELGLNDDD